MRTRPESEWVWVDSPDLRIISDDLWAGVQKRRRQRAWLPNSRVGGRRKYLLSGLLRCGDCSGNYVVQFHRAGETYYGCAVHHDRGAEICRNRNLVRRERIEDVTLKYVFGGLFTEPRLDYLTRAVDAALQRALREAPNTLVQRERALADAKRELENIATAIRMGIITPTTKAMLEDAERRVQTLDEAVRVSHQRPPRVVSVRTVVEHYLRDLRATLETNVDAGRRLLSLAVNKIVLRSEGKQLVAEFCGNLGGVLSLEPGLLGCIGAGRGI